MDVFKRSSANSFRLVRRQRSSLGVEIYLFKLKEVFSIFLSTFPSLEKHCAWFFGDLKGNNLLLKVWCMALSPHLRQPLWTSFSFTAAKSTGTLGRFL
jgi:hypothetical protein